MTLCFTHYRGTAGDAAPAVWSFDDTGKSHPFDVNYLIIFEAVAAAVAWKPETTSKGTESWAQGATE